MAWKQKGFGGEISSETDKTLQCLGFMLIAERYKHLIVMRLGDDTGRS